MGAAIWLSVAFPEWYFSALRTPFSGMLLFSMPAAGVVCLGLGCIAGVVSRDIRLLRFLVPIALSELLVAIAGSIRSKVPSSAVMLVLIFFLAIQVALNSYFVYRFKGARFASTLLLAFSLSYAVFAAFFAGMTFGENWN